MTEYTKAHKEALSTTNFYPDGQVPWQEAYPPDTDTLMKHQGRMKSCSYCGSAHPADVAAAIRAGASGSWADRKYGWPHKAYFDGVPNPHAGLMESVASSSQKPSQSQLDTENWLPPVEGERPQWWRQLSPAPATTYLKFYTVHLLDATPEDRDTIEQHLGLKFTFVDNDTRVRWTPYPKDE